MTLLKPGRKIVTLCQTSKLVNSSDTWPQLNRINDLRRSTNLAILMRKKTVPCKTKYSITTRVKNIIYHDRAKWFNQNLRSKALSFGASNTTYKGVPYLPSRGLEKTRPWNVQLYILVHFSCPFAGLLQIRRNDVKRMIWSRSKPDWISYRVTTKKLKTNSNVLPRQMPWLALLIISGKSLIFQR